MEVMDEVFLSGRKCQNHVPEVNGKICCKLSISCNHPSKDYPLFKAQSPLWNFSHRGFQTCALKKSVKNIEYLQLEVMAFGDATNDHTMLEPSGVGVCFEKAAAMIQGKIADII